MLAASTARAAGSPAGNGVTAVAGTTYAVWCGKQAEDLAAEQYRLAGLDDADAGIAVLDREREPTCLERRLHDGILAGRNFPQRYQRLGATADTGPQAAHADLAGAGTRQLAGADLSLPGPVAQ